MHPRKQSRRYYLNDVPLDQALRKFFSALESVGALELSPAEIIPLDKAAARVTAEPIWARLSSPHYDSAAMDGVAVRARDTVGATETSPVRLKVGQQAAWVDTGQPLPPEFDAVIMVEVVHEVDETTIEILSPVAPYQHVRTLGRISSPRSCFYRRITRSVRLTWEPAPPQVSPNCPSAAVLRWR